MYYWFLLTWICCIRCKWETSSVDVYTCTFAHLFNKRRVRDYGIQRLWRAMWVACRSLSS